jgi:hypothetical protein
MACIQYVHQPVSNFQPLQENLQDSKTQESPTPNYFGSTSYDVQSIGKLLGETKIDYKEEINNYYSGFKNLSDYKENLNKREETIIQANKRILESYNEVLITENQTRSVIPDNFVIPDFNGVIPNISLKRDFVECLEFVENSRNYILIREDSIMNILKNANLEDFPTEIRSGSLQLTKYNYADIKNAITKIIDNMQHNKNIMPLMTVYNKYKSVIFEGGEFKIETNDFNMFKKYIREQARDSKEAFSIWVSLVEKTVPLKKHKLFIKMVLYFLDKNEKIENE